MTEKNYDVAFIVEAPKDGLIVLYGNEHDVQWLLAELKADFHKHREPWQKGQLVEIMERTRRMGFHKEADDMEDDIRSEFGPVNEEGL